MTDLIQSACIIVLTLIVLRLIGAQREMLDLVKLNRQLVEANSENVKTILDRSEYRG